MIPISYDYWYEPQRTVIRQDKQSLLGFSCFLSEMAKRSMTVENEKDLWRKTNSNQYVWSIEHIFPQGSNIPDEWVDKKAAFFSSTKNSL